MDRLNRPEYPRSSTYDPQWLIESDMGPHPLWLLEDLATNLDLRPGMRVWATDLWISPDDAAATFAAQGVADSVCAVRANAHALPFGREYFDAIVSIDAFEYFGTADSYLPYLAGFLRPGGQLGIATPALTSEVRDLGAIPPHINTCVGWEAIAWHTADWWRFQWDITEVVTVTSARLQESGWRDWLRWAEVCAEHGNRHPPTLDMLRADQGRYLTFALVTRARTRRFGAPHRKAACQ